MDDFTPDLPTPSRRSARATTLDVREHALALIAERQRGVVSLDQLLGLDFTRSSVAERCLRGSLHRIAPTVYAVGHPGIGRGGKAMAALLQVGGDAGLSHDSAARWWKMKGRSNEGPVHVSVRNRSTRVRPEGVVLHRPRLLGADELVMYRGLRVTTPERTIIDHLAEAPVVDLTRMLEQMVTELGRDPDGLTEWGRTVSPRQGRHKLLHALDWVAGPAVIRSEFEALFRSVCQEASLPAAQTNMRIGRWEVDAVYPVERVAVELDSWRFHGGRWQFHQDRRKGLAISRAGYELIRLSWWQLKHEPHDVTDALRFALMRGQQRVVGH